MDPPRFAYTIYYDNPNVNDSRECILIGGTRNAPELDASLGGIKKCVKFNVDTHEFTHFGNL